MNTHKYEIGQKVVFDGLVATIESKEVYAGSQKPCYGIVADENSELTCTASEEFLELYDGEEIDQSERIKEAEYESQLISLKMNAITDKYIGDNSF